MMGKLCASSPVKFGRFYLGEKKREARTGPCIFSPCVTRLFFSIWGLGGTVGWAPRTVGGKGGHSCNNWASDKTSEKKPFKNSLKYSPPFNKAFWYYRRLNLW